MEKQLTTLSMTNTNKKKATIVKAAGDFKFTEGAAWHPRGFFLFSDTPANKIYRLFSNGDLDIFLYKSGLTAENTDELSDQVGSNGLTMDTEENIIICQHGNHAIAQLDKNKKLTTIIHEYGGRPFNSPNDVIISSDGTIFFTDPPYGLTGQVLHPDRFQPVAGIYQHNAMGTFLAGTELKYPNGLLFSADEKFLFVSSNHRDDPGIVRYALSANRLPRYDGIFIKQPADGMTTGPDGNIYLATDEGVLIVSPDGQKLAVMTLPETPSTYVSAV